MYLRDLTHWDDESPLIVGPFRSDAQAKPSLRKWAIIGVAMVQRCFRRLLI
jgi:hypothetical protein